MGSQIRKTKAIRAEVSRAPEDRASKLSEGSIRTHVGSERGAAGVPWLEDSGILKYVWDASHRSSSVPAVFLCSLPHVEIQLRPWVASRKPLMLTSAL